MRRDRHLHDEAAGHCGEIGGRRIHLVVSGPGVLGGHSGPTAQGFWTRRDSVGRITSCGPHRSRYCRVTSDRRTLEFFFFDAGGGHRSAAIALRDVIAERYPGWTIELINLQEILGPVD